MDAAYRPKKFDKISLFAPAGFEFAHNRDHTNRIRNFRATWNKAWKEAGLGCGYKLNANMLKKDGYMFTS